jgi:hypothetical protein
MHRNTGFRTCCYSVAVSLLCTFLSWIILVGFLAGFILPQPGHAGSPLPGRITFGFGGSEQEITESFDTLFPLYGSKDGLFFFDPRVTASDKVDPRVSLGLGYRQLFEESQVILGANVGCRVRNVAAVADRRVAAITVTLLESEIPAHSHGWTASNQFGTDQSPINEMFAPGVGGIAMYAAPGSITQLAPNALTPAGGDQPHNNLIPYLTLNFCIALQGVYPPRT